MKPRFLFLLIIYTSFLILPAYATSLTFSDQNIIARQIEIYKIGANGTELVQLGTTSNSTITFDNDASYTVVLKTSPYTFFDDPFEMVHKLLTDIAPNLISFAIVATVLLGPIIIVAKNL